MWLGVKFETLESKYPKLSKQIQRRCVCVRACVLACVLACARASACVCVQGGVSGRENNKDQMAGLFLHLPQAPLSSLIHFTHFNFSHSCSFPWTPHTSWVVHLPDVYSLVSSNVYVLGFYLSTFSRLRIYLGGRPSSSVGRVCSPWQKLYPRWSGPRFKSDLHTYAACQHRYVSHLFSCPVNEDPRKYL